jgi:hypothetical protein
VVIAPLLLEVSSPEAPLYVTTAGTILPGILGGILFGVPFFVVTRRIPKFQKLRTYLLVSGWAFIILDISLSADVMNAPYLPFGFATSLFTSTSTYLLAVGLYSSATTIASDASLRALIKARLLGESKLLDSIGSAEEMQEITERVVQITKKKQSSVLEESGIGSSLTDQEIRDYMAQVMDEMRRHT